MYDYNSTSLYRKHPAGERTNFTQCHLYYAGLSQDVKFSEDLAWTGRVIGISRNESTQIKTWACKDICGAGNDWYPWTQQASTITTWVLPVVGILLQAPFVSNAFWETIFALARWVGSPICTLSYILWNIKITGKCALLLDMAVPYDKQVTSRQTDFGKMRDSFYLLTSMNQFTMRPHVRQKKEAEGLLRIALFSKDLRLLKLGKSPDGRIARTSSEGPILSGNGWRSDLSTGNHLQPSPPRPEEDLEPLGYLNELRQTTAEEMRSGRKRGVVPVFISTLWFLFSLGLSIQAAFGFLGENAQAHDLALGLLLAWLPVLILSSIADRNPIAADDIKDRLNNLVDRVRCSLMDDTVRQKFLASITNQEQQVEMRQWVESISEKCPTLNNFFVQFAGQGRKRYHYGAAHPILTDIERAYIADEGRDWLCDEERARNKLVHGEASGGLDWLDPRELWQVFSAVTIVGGAIVGAFVLSFFTPTVGLGCRSGGYTVFGTIAFGLLLAEMVSWWIFDASKPRFEHLSNNIRRHTLEHPYLATSWERFLFWQMRQRAAFDRVSLRWVLAGRHFLQNILSKLASEQVANSADKKLKSLWLSWQEMTAQKRLDYCFFKPFECANAVWLFYIVLAQTIGSYRNCECMSSTWAAGGGYIDWNNYNTATSKNVNIFWTSGAVLSVTTMSIAMFYIVIEWCVQSHLSTANMHSAARGLQRTRRFRRITNPFRKLMHHIIEAGYRARLLLFRLCIKAGLSDSPEQPRSSRRSLRWTTEVTCKNPQHDHPLTGRPMTTGLPPSRAREESEAPLITGRDADGLPIAVDTETAPMHTRADTPSSRSSYDVPPSPGTGPSTT